MPRKILVVDDNQTILDALSFMLSTEGYTVITDTGVTVLKTVKKYHPSIILLDVLLSEKDGREICKQIKTLKNGKSIPIILLSAHPSMGKTYKKYGADDFLAKPFNNQTLLSLIEKYSKK